MTAIKRIVIGLFIVLFIGFIIINKALVNVIEEKEETEKRLIDNIVQLMDENEAKDVLILKQKELADNISQERDDLSKQLKIRPKEIVKVVYEERIIRDTIREVVKIEKQRKDFWHLNDKKKCFQYEADIYLMGDSLNVWRSNFVSKDSIEDVYWWEREKKIWFIRYGKKVYYNKRFSECSESQIREINFIKD